MSLYWTSLGGQLLILAQIELGTACGKLFRCSTMVVLDAGDSDILSQVVAWEWPVKTYTFGKATGIGAGYSVQTPSERWACSTADNHVTLISGQPTLSPRRCSNRKTWKCIFESLASTFSCVLWRTQKVLPSLHNMVIMTLNMTFFDSSFTPDFCYLPSPTAV